MIPLFHSQEEVRQLKIRLDSAYQELFGQPDVRSLTSNHPAVEIEIDSKSSGVSGSRLQLSRAITLQPCLSLTSKTKEPTLKGAHSSCVI